MGRQDSPRQGPLEPAYSHCRGRDEGHMKKRSAQRAVFFQESIPGAPHRRKHHLFQSPYLPFPQPCRSGEIVLFCAARFDRTAHGSDHSRGSLELGCFECGLGPKPDRDRERHVMAAGGDVVIVDGE